MWTDEQLKQWLGESWYEQLKHEFKMPYMKKLHEFLQLQRVDSPTVLPSEDNVFRYFKDCPYEQTLVVIVGMDPGLNSGNNSFKTFTEEIINDVYDGLPFNNKNPLATLPKQGVLLLDTVLTYDLNNPFKHVNQGWEQFVEYVIKRLNNKPNKTTFVLLGEYVKQYDKFINENFHKVIHVPHPKKTELFKGTKVFSQVNNFLKANYNVEVDW